MPVFADCCSRYNQAALWRPAYVGILAHGQDARATNSNPFDAEG